MPTKNSTAICEYCHKPFETWPCMVSKRKFCGLPCYQSHQRDRQKPIEQRFFDYVDKNGPIIYEHLGPCHIWTGPKDKYGYGAIGFNGKIIKAHRLAMKIAGKPVPDNMCVLHRCDNPPCVNDFHLYSGTRTQNAEDRKIRKRYISPITEEIVREIRKIHRDGVKGIEISRRLKLDSSTVYGIIKRRTWKYID